MNKYLKYGIMGVIAVSLSAILFKPEPQANEPAPRSYEEIIRSGVLRAVTEYNSISYHAQADSIGGLQNERGEKNRRHTARHLRPVGQQRIDK